MCKSSNFLYSWGSLNWIRTMKLEPLPPQLFYWKLLYYKCIHVQFFTLLFKLIKTHRHCIKDILISKCTVHFPEKFPFTSIWSFDYYVFLYTYHILTPLLISLCGLLVNTTLNVYHIWNITSLRDTLNPFPKFYNQMFISYPKPIEF